MEKQLLFDSHFYKKMRENVATIMTHQCPLIYNRFFTFWRRSLFLADSPRYTASMINIFLNDTFLGWIFYPFCQILTLLNNLRFTFNIFFQRFDCPKVIFPWKIRKVIIKWQNPCNNSQRRGDKCDWSSDISFSYFDYLLLHYFLLFIHKACQLSAGGSIKF